MSDNDIARQRTGLSSDEALVNQEHNPKYVEALKRGKLDYSAVPWPAIWGMVQAMNEGAGKYGRFNYRQDKIEARTYIAAICRHLFGDPSTGSVGWVNGEDIDVESGLHHLDKVMACCLLVRDAMEHGMLIDNRLQTESKTPPSVRGDIDGVCEEGIVDFKTGLQPGPLMKFEDPSNFRVYPATNDFEVRISGDPLDVDFDELEIALDLEAINDKVNAMQKYIEDCCDMDLEPESGAFVDFRDASPGDAPYV